MLRISSDRAVDLVLSARLNYRKQSSEEQVESPQANSVFSSPATSSPVPSWFDDVFEASDLTKVQQRPSRSKASVKRQLFFSPEKDAAAEIPEAGSACKENVGPLPSLQGHFSVDKLTAGTANSCSIKQGKSLKGVTEDTPNSQKSTGACTDHRVLAIVSSNDNEDVSVPDRAACSPSWSSRNLSGTPFCAVSALPISKELYPSHQKIYRAKLALNSGREHVTSKGKVRQARCIRAPCQERCKRCQSPKLSDQERLRINKNFWDLQDHLKQWKFIKDSLEISVPKKKVSVPGSKGEKLSSRVYSFLLDGKPRTVCKTMFKNTLCICDSWIDSAILHCSSGLLEDRRGKHSNRTKRAQKVT